MNLIGKLVTHNKYGVGKIMSLTESIVTIRFDESEKRFLYPEAFKSFLVCKSTIYQDYIEKQISNKEITIQMRDREKREASARRKALNILRPWPDSHLILNVPVDQIDTVYHTYRASTGVFLSGSVKGLPRATNRVKPNSLCLITCCPRIEDESKRTVVGAFMVADDFYGEKERNGVVRLHQKYHFILPENQRVLLWRQLKQSPPARWGGIPFKYCTDAAANNVLSHLISTVSEKDQRIFLKEFYSYFCKLNHLRSLLKW